MDKKDFRKKMADLRGAIPEKERLEKSRLILSRLIETEAYRNAAKIFCFISMGSEPDTVELINYSLEKGKKVACPIAIPKTRNMPFVEITSLNGLKRSKYGVLEPEYDEGKVCLPDNESLIIIPGLAFDKNGYRIGYGGGYYDTYIENNPLGYKAGIAFSDMLAENVPVMAHDKKIDLLVTDTEVYIWKAYS